MPDNLLPMTSIAGDRKAPSPNRHRYEEELRLKAARLLGATRKQPGGAWPSS